MSAAATCRRLVGWLSPGLLLLSAHGQDALFSSLSLDQSVTANPSPLPPNQPHWGPVQFALGTDAGEIYDDNINSAEFNPESDLISHAGLDMGLFWPATENSQLRLGSQIGYLVYQKYTANNGLEVNPDSALTYAVSVGEVTLTAFDQFSYTRQVHAQAALANIATLPQLDNNSGVRAQWQPGHWDLTASYSHDESISDHAHDYLNRSSEYFFGRAGWRFAKVTETGVEVSDSLTYYQVPYLGNPQNLSVGAFVDWQIRPALRLTLRGGPVLFQTDAPASAGGQSTLDSYYLSITASHQLTQHLSQTLDVERSLQPGVNQGSSYFEQLSVMYGVARQLAQWLTLGASINYADGQQPLELPFGVPVSAAPAGSENYQQYGGGAQVTWTCTSHLTASLSYNHWQRDSNVIGRNNSDNSVAFQLNYRF